MEERPEHYMIHLDLVHRGMMHSSQLRDQKNGYPANAPESRRAPRRCPWPHGARPRALLRHCGGWTLWAFERPGFCVQLVSMFFGRARERAFLPTCALIPQLLAANDGRVLWRNQCLWFTQERCVRVKPATVPLTTAGLGLSPATRLWFGPDKRRWQRPFFRRANSDPLTDTTLEQATRSALSRSFEESKLVPFTVHELYSVVADVERYQEFVPWCTGSRIVRRFGERLLEAELKVGFQLFHEEYISLVRLEPGRAVRATATTSRLFEYLVNEWRFRPAENPKESWVYFYVDFRFRSPLYRAAVDLFFNEVAKKMVRAFEQRAQVVHREHVQPPSSIKEQRT